MKNLLLLTMAIGILACNSDPDPVKAPLAPVANAATEVGSNGFIANWQSSVGANDYELDLATDINFSDIVDSIKNIPGTFYVFDSLRGNTEYFYQVRAILDSTHVSENSNIISLTTLLEAPQALFQSKTSKTSFNANWRAVTDVSNYLLYVSLDSFPADPPNNLLNYNGIIVSDTTQTVTGLTAGTVYYYVVRSKLGALLSEESNTIRAATRF